MRTLALSKRQARIFLHKLPTVNDTARDAIKYRELVNTFKHWINPYDKDVEACLSRAKDLNMQTDTEAELKELNREIRALDTEGDGCTQVEIDLEEADFLWAKNRWFNAKGFGTTDRELSDLYAAITGAVQTASENQKQAVAGGGPTPIRPEVKALEAQETEQGVAE